MKSVHGGTKNPSLVKSRLAGANAAFANLAILFFILVVAGNEFRWLSRETSLQFWTVLPLILLKIWMCHWRQWDWFLWLKLFSVIPCAVVAIDLSRFGDWDQQIMQVEWFTLLSINIMEAVIKDLCSDNARSIWSPMNAFVGIFLILTELSSLHTIRISENETHDFLWTFGIPWILAYTIWNWTLVYNNYPYAIGRHTALLLAPVVLSLNHGWDVWFETRVYTLAFYALLRSTFYYRFRQLMDVSDPFPSRQSKRNIQALVFCCNLILLSALIVTKGWQYRS